MSKLSIQDLYQQSCEQVKANFLLRSFLLKAVYRVETFIYNSPFSDALSICASMLQHYMESMTGTMLTTLHYMLQC